MGQCADAQAEAKAGHLLFEGLHAWQGVQLFAYAHNSVRCGDEGTVDGMRRQLRTTRANFSQSFCPSSIHKTNSFTCPKNWFQFQNTHSLSEHKTLSSAT